MRLPVCLYLQVRELPHSVHFALQEAGPIALVIGEMDLNPNGFQEDFRLLYRELVLVSYEMDFVAALNKCVGNVRHGNEVAHLADGDAGDPKTRHLAVNELGLRWNVLRP